MNIWKSYIWTADIKRRKYESDIRSEWTLLKQQWKWGLKKKNLCLYGAVNIWSLSYSQLTLFTKDRQEWYLYRMIRSSSIHFLTIWQNTWLSGTPPSHTLFTENQQHPYTALIHQVWAGLLAPTCWKVWFVSFDVYWLKNSVFEFRNFLADRKLLGYTERAQSSWMEF